MQFSIDNGGTLIVDYSRHRQSRERVYFDITMPSVRRLAFDGAASAKLTGFHQQNDDLHIILNGASGCTVSGLPSLLEADLSGAGKLVVSVTAADLIATISGAASMDAYGATFSDADVSIWCSKAQGGGTEFSFCLSLWQ